jgi:hypothetical protein
MSSAKSCPDHCTKQLSSQFRSGNYDIEKSTGQFNINTTIAAYEVQFYTISNLKYRDF